MSQSKTLRELTDLLAECRDKSRNNSLEGSIDERDAWAGMGDLLDRAVRLSLKADHEGRSAERGAPMPHQVQTAEAIDAARREGCKVVGIDYPAGYGSATTLAMLADALPGLTLLVCSVGSHSIVSEGLLGIGAAKGPLDTYEKIALETYANVKAALRRDPGVLGRFTNLVLSEAYPGDVDPRDEIRAAAPDAFVVEQVGWGDRDPGIEVLVKVDRDLAVTVERPGRGIEPGP